MSKPQALKTVMKRFLQRERTNEAYLQGRVLSVWNVCVGSTIAAHTKALKFYQKGVLTVYMSDHLWKQELHMRREHIKGLINKTCGNRYLERIDIRQSSLKD